MIKKFYLANVMKGFTLLEILAVLAIAGLLSAVAVPSGFNFWARLQLEEAQSTVGRALRTARTNAQSSLSGRQWGVYIDNDGPASVLVIRDVDELCNEPAPCQRIQLGNLVTVTSDFGLDQNAEFDSRGQVSFLGSFTVVSDILPGQRRCVTVSTLLGSIRNDSSDTCGAQPSDDEE